MYAHNITLRYSWWIKVRLSLYDVTVKLNFERLYTNNPHSLILPNQTFAINFAIFALFNVKLCPMTGNLRSHDNFPLVMPNNPDRLMVAGCMIKYFSSHYCLFTCSFLQQRLNSRSVERIHSWNLNTVAPLHITCFLIGWILWAEHVDGGRISLKGFIVKFEIWEYEQVDR